MSVYITYLIMVLFGVVGGVLLRNWTSLRDDKHIIELASSEEIILLLMATSIKLKYLKGELK